MKKFVALATAGTILLSASPALARFSEDFGASVTARGKHREKAEKILERKLDSRVDDILKRAKENEDKAKHMDRDEAKRKINRNFLNGVKRGWVKQLSRFDQCVEDASTGEGLTQHCTALTEFKKLLEECRKEKESGTTLTERCRKVAKHLTDWPKSKSSGSTGSTGAATSGSTTSASSDDDNDDDHDDDSSSSKSGSSASGN